MPRFYLPGYRVALMSLVATALLIGLQQSAQADGTAGPHRIGLHSVIIDSSWYTVSSDFREFLFSGEIGAHYDWSALRYFSLGGEFTFSKPINNDNAITLDANLYRLGFRLRGMLPLVNDQLELFAAIHGGLLVADQKPGGVSRGLYAFGGIGLAWWFIPNLGISFGLETGLDIAGGSLQYGDADYMMFHMIRVPIELHVRF